MIPLAYNIPYITKMTSDSVIYDSIGDLNKNHIHLHYDSNYIYFLMNDNGLCVEYNIVDETEKNVDIVKVNTDKVNSIIKINNVLYGVYGYQVTKFIDNTVLYIEDNTKLVQQSIDTTSDLKVTHLSSRSNIRDFFVDEDFNYYVLHGVSTISKFTKERKLIYSIEVKNTTTTGFYEIGIPTNTTIEFIKMDYVREYTSNGLSSYPIILGFANNTKNLFLIKIDEKNQTILGSPVLLKDVNNNILNGMYIPYGDDNRINYNLTNYEFLKNKYSSSKKLMFKLVLKNTFDNKDSTTIEVPIDTNLFQSEKHHFAIRMDSMNGIVSIFRDGELVDSYDIPAGKYLFQDVLYEGMSIGNTYYRNNKSLDQYLGQSGYYFAKNLEVEQFKMYNKALTDNEIKFLIYNNTKVDDLLVSLPSGQRNGLDGIERQFKFDVGGSKSNKVNIIIKNSKFTNQELKDKMSEIIRERLKKVIPVTSDIYNIEFRS